MHLTKGYSRDHRPDLNRAANRQVVLNLITDNQAGIPLHMEALDGNSDRRPVAIKWSSEKPFALKALEQFARQCHYLQVEALPNQKTPFYIRYATSHRA